MIWLIGNNGMLGREVELTLQKRGVEYAASDIEVDISNRASVSAFMDAHPDIEAVINCAGYTDVDKAEQEREIAFVLNGEAPGNLAKICIQRDAALYHISTDYVFPGTGDVPWDTDSPTDPVNTYGESKLQGEKNIIGSGCRYAILRTQWLFGTHGMNFVDTVKNRILDGSDFRIVNDQVGAATWAADLSGVILACTEKNLTGIYHAVNGGYASWYEIACEIQNILGTHCALTPCSSEEYPMPAARPKNSRLSPASLERAGISMRPWQEALEEYLGNSE